MHEQIIIDRAEPKQVIPQLLPEKLLKTRNLQVLVDLLLGAVLAEEATENALAANPDDLGGEASLAGTTALTIAGVATLALGLEALQKRK